MCDETDLTLGGGRWIDSRYIVPVIRSLAVCRGESAAVSLAPVALLFFEGEVEYMVLLPGAPPDTREMIKSLQSDIEREKRDL